MTSPTFGRTSDICLDAAQRAASASDVPYAVLFAITQTETGRDQSGVIRPWPWTLNIRGEGFWLDTQGAALDMMQQTIARGETSFDVGCFQINYRWHSQHFASLDQMLAPDVGATYAAKFLQQLYDETGNWSAAAGAYHSRTPVYATRYRQRFDGFLASADAGPPSLIAKPPHQNTFPLLRSGTGRRALGSLVPVFEGT